MSDDAGGPAGFSGEFDDSFALGESGSQAFFGLDVLRGFTSGIDAFLAELRPSSRILGGALLGSAMWIDDDEVLETLDRLAAACIVVTKQRRTLRQLAKIEKLQRFNERAPGMPITAFPCMGDFAPKVDGAPQAAGPYTPLGDAVLPTIRTLGFRQTSDLLVPIVHAKLALFGHLWWHDEGALGHVEDVIGFKPLRLWISSANFTRQSREGLEFGYWTQEPQLLDHAERFLVKLLQWSEDLDPASDVTDPELAPVDFDVGAIAEALAEAQGDDDADSLNY